MSAEIISLSLRGVAIATDSTSTYTRADGSKKFLTNTNKITSFSRNVPIAIVTQGNRNFNGIPFELLIRDFKNKNENTKWNTVEECFTGFMRYIGTCGIDYLNYGSMYADRVLAICFSRIEQIYEESGGSVKKFKASIKELQTKNDLFFNDYYSSLDSDNLNDRIKAAYSDRIRKWLANDFTGRQACTESICKNIIEYCTDSMRKFDFAEHDSVTFAIVGYGKDEFMPTYIDCTVYAVVCASTYFSLDSKINISTRNPKEIGFLTHNNFFENFINGIDPSFASQLIRKHASMVNTIKSDISKELETQLAGTNIDINTVNRILNKHFKDLDLYSPINEIRDNFWMDLFRNFSGFSVDDLADISESLVKLIAFRKRMTCEDQDVGGAIDVAVITKANGFVWKKRKQYFKRELNEHLF